jgi:hypothetical protein
VVDINTDDGQDDKKYEKFWDTTHPCKTCDFKGKNKSELKVHMKTLHDIPTPMKVLPLTPSLLGPAKCKCFICPEHYLEGEWESHEKTDHAFECAVCDTFCVTQDEHNEHVTTFHGKGTVPLPSHVQTDCTKTDHEWFSILYAHMKSCHIQCEDCGITVVNQTSMEEHIKSNHKTD